MLRRLLVLDAQTDFVQQGCVAQDRATVALGEAPGRLQLGERLDGGVADPLGVLLVELVAADQAVGGAIPGITIVIVAEQAVDEPFTQCTTRQVMLDVEGLEDGDQDGETGGNTVSRSAASPSSCNLSSLPQAMA